MKFKDDDLVVLDEKKLPFKIYHPSKNVYTFKYVKKQQKWLREQYGKEVIFFDRYRLATKDEVKNVIIVSN